MAAILSRSQCGGMPQDILRMRSLWIFWTFSSFPIYHQSFKITPDATYQFKIRHIGSNSCVYTDGL